MTQSTLLPCDGCGQPADSAHLARRLERLEWATRFRPIHVQAVLLAFAQPTSNTDFLYAPEGAFTGPAADLLEALALPFERKSRDEVLTGFQKRGLLLAHLLECPLEAGVTPEGASALAEKQLPSAVARIRRSFRPKRVLLVSPELRAFEARLTEPALGCPVYPVWLESAGKPGAVASAEGVQRLRAALPALAAHSD